MLKWSGYGAWRSLHVSLEVRLRSAYRLVADKDSVIQCLAHSQQGRRLLTQEFVDQPVKSYCTPHDDLHVIVCELCLH